MIYPRYTGHRYTRPKETKMIYVRYKKLTDTAMEPTKGSAFAAGYDLYADTTQEIVVEPGDTVNFYTGIAVEIPDGYCGKIYSRSGLSTKHGMRLANCVAVIDADYRGNVGIPMHNDSDTAFTVMPHERLAQIVIEKVPSVTFYETDELSKTDRGNGGFGSSGRI